MRYIGELCLRNYLDKVLMPIIPFNRVEWYLDDRSGLSAEIHTKTVREE